MDRQMTQSNSLNSTLFLRDSVSFPQELSQALDADDDYCYFCFPHHFYMPQKFFHQLNYELQSHFQITPTNMAGRFSAFSPQGSKLSS